MHMVKKRYGYDGPGTNIILLWTVLCPGLVNDWGTTYSEGEGSVVYVRGTN